MKTIELFEELFNKKNNQQLFIQYEIMNDTTQKIGKIPLSNEIKPNSVSIDDIDLIKVFEKIAGELLSQDVIPMNNKQVKTENKINRAYSKIIEELYEATEQPPVQNPPVDQTQQSTQNPPSEQTEQPVEEPTEENNVLGDKFKQLDKIFNNYTHLILSIVKETEKKIDNKIQFKKMDDNVLSVSIISAGQKVLETNLTKETADTVLKQIKTNMENIAKMETNK
jgi:hypothetical protein